MVVVAMHFMFGNSRRLRREEASSHIISFEVLQSAAASAPPSFLCHREITLLLVMLTKRQGVASVPPQAMAVQQEKSTQAIRKL